MEQTDKYIWKIEEGECADDPAVNGSGWYFVDETERFAGPYASRQEAIDALEHYAKEL